MPGAICKGGDNFWYMGQSGGPALTSRVLRKYYLILHPCFVRQLPYDPQACLFKSILQCFLDVSRWQLPNFFFFMKWRIGPFFFEACALQVHVTWFPWIATICTYSLLPESTDFGTYLMVQWLGFHTSTSGGTGSIPGWGTKTPKLLGVDKRKEKENEVILIPDEALIWVLSIYLKSFQGHCHKSIFICKVPNSQS